MENTYLQSRHPALQLVLLAVITLVIWLAVTLASIVAGAIFFRIPLTEWIGLLDMNNPSNVPVLKFLQITQSLSMFVIPPIVFGWFMMHDPWRYLSLRRAPEGRPALLVLALAVFILPVLNLLSALNQGLQLPHFLTGLEQWMQTTEDQAGRLTELFLGVTTFGGYLVNVLMVVLLPAFGEEFFFRGTLQPIFQRWFKSPHAAIIVTAVLFSAFHLQFYGFLPRFLLGALFGYLYWWSGNIWYPVLAHLVNNFLPVTLTFFFRESFDPAQLDQVGTGPDAWLWAVPGLVLGVLAFWLFHQLTRAKTRPELENQSVNNS